MIVSCVCMTLYYSRIVSLSGVALKSADTRKSDRLCFINARNTTSTLHCDKTEMFDESYNIIRCVLFHDHVLTVN